jgi:hypothetical protein
MLLATLVIPCVGGEARRTVTPGTAVPLEFRVVPNPLGSSRQPVLGPGKPYLDDLAANGPLASRKRGAELQWFETRMRSASGLLTATHKGKRYVLLCGSESQVLRVGGAGLDRLRLQEVTLRRGEHGLEIVLEFDETGRRLFLPFTRENMHNRVAIVANGIVISAPTVQSAIHESVAISGHFTTEEAADIASRLMRTIDSRDHFLGLPDDAEAKYERGRIAGLTRVTTVREATLVDYEQVKDRKGIKAQRRRGDWLYYAVEQGRDVPVANATVRVSVTHRYKVRVPIATPASLTTPLGRAVLGLFADMATPTGKNGHAPGEFTDPEFVAEYLEKLERDFPGFLTTTPAQEKLYAAGKFDDDANRKAMDAAIEELKGPPPMAPMFAQFVMSWHQAGKLAGAKLEVGRRLMESVLKKARRAYRIELQGDGALRVNGKPVADVPAIIRGMRATNTPQDADVLVDVDTTARYADVVRVLTALKNAGYTKIQLDVDTTPDAP